LEELGDSSRIFQQVDEKLEQNIKLKVENKRFREALEKIIKVNSYSVDHCDGYVALMYQYLMKDIAKQALESEEI
jgi:regulator of replication initiation timing